MNRFCSLIRAIPRIVLSAVCLFGLPAVVRAEDAPPPSGTTSWSMSYALVVLGVVLGMLMVLRPSSRRERAKKE